MTRDQLLNGCILSSLAHAIMTNIYPDLAYEMSWDCNSFSVVDTNFRGTVTFLANTCVGAVRNDEETMCYGSENILELIQGFPREVIDVAVKDVLQYLLVLREGQSVPAITGVFYCDNKGIYSLFENTLLSMKECSLFRFCMLPKYEAIKELTDYYDMDKRQIELLHQLYDQRISNLSEKIILSQCQIELIPGEGIKEECVQSFQEIGVFFKAADI